MVSQAELELARIAAESAAKILPNLKDEAAQLQQRIAWLEGYIDAWKKLKPAEPSKGQYLKVGETFSIPIAAAVVPTTEANPGKKFRSARGAPQKHISAVFTEHPDWPVPKICQEVGVRFGVLYPPSTAYRIVRELKESLQDSLPVASGQ